MRLRPAIRLSLMAPILASLSGCSWRDGFFAAAGPVAAEQRMHFLTVSAWMLVVVVPLFVALPLVLWRYRRKNGKGSHKPEWEFNWVLETLVWGIPVVIVLFMAINLWGFTKTLDPYSPLPARMSTKKPLQVDVVMLDWKFLFLYPQQGVATVNHLVIPAGRPVHFRLTSATVMQSFDIPRLGSQIYGMAGMVTQVTLMAGAPGRFRGLNTQYNGVHFPEDHFTTDALPAKNFAKWVEGVRASAHPLDKAALAKVMQRSVPPAPVIFSSYSKGLFGRIVQSFHKADTRATS